MPLFPFPPNGTTVPYGKLPRMAVQQTVGAEVIVIADAGRDRAFNEGCRCIRVAGYLQFKLEIPEGTSVKLAGLDKIALATELEPDRSNQHRRAGKKG